MSCHYGPIPRHLVISNPVAGSKDNSGQCGPEDGMMPDKQMSGHSDLQHFCLFVAPVPVEITFLLTEAPTEPSNPGPLV